jgi:hypothetical protein
MFPLTRFTSYSNLKPIYTNLLKEEMNATQEQLNKTYTALSYTCNTTGNETIYVQSIKLKCSDIISITPTDLPELVGNVTFDEIYFRKYNCSFFQCIQLPEEEKFLFFMSEQTNKFFEKMIIYLLFVASISLFIFVISIKTWPERFRAVGISLLFIGISHFFINIAKGYIEQKFVEQTEKISPIINQILDPVSTNLLIIFIIGLILTIIGFVLSYLVKRKFKKK